MSKSKKKFYVTLSLVALVLGLGVFALVQSFRSNGGSGKQEEHSHGVETPPASDEESTPSPEDTIVRANNDDSPAAPPSSFNPAQPPAQFGGAFAAQPIPQHDLDAPPHGRSHIRQVAHEEPTPADPAEAPVGTGVQPDPSPERSGLQPVDGSTFSALAPTTEEGPADPPGSFSPPPADSQPYNPPPSDMQAYDPPAVDPSLAPSAAVPGGTFGGYDAQPAPAAAPAPLNQEPNGYAPGVGLSSPPASLQPESTGSSYADIASAAERSATLQSGVSGGGVPGPQELEGPQAPSLSIVKTAPPEIQVNKPAAFNIRVQNTGRVDAHEVQVRDQVPTGVRLIDSTPAPARDADGSLLWNLGTIRPGEEATIVLRVLPMAEGEIGSTASVTFAAQATVRTFCTKPLLAVKQVAPRQVLIGQEAAITIEISNPGTGEATGVVLEEDVPEQFLHPAGRELEHTIGSLKPGETRELELRLKADKPGVAHNVILLRGEGNLIAQHEVEVEVVAPNLAVGMTGPRLRYLERQATYTVSVSNPGTAPAKNVDLVAHLPRGLKFVSTNNAGQYDAQRHAVFWSLEQLPAKETGSVQLTTLPIEIGEQKIRVEGSADLNLEHASEEVVMVEGLAELFFQVRDEADPIELGSDTVYAVQITNQGSVPAANVVVTAILPPELQPIGGEGPSRVKVEGQSVVFEPLARLTPKSDAVYRIQVKGRTAGDHRIRVQVSSDQTSPVTKEESTRVYSDR